MFLSTFAVTIPCRCALTTFSSTIPIPMKKTSSNGPTASWMLAQDVSASAILLANVSASCAAPRLSRKQTIISAQGSPARKIIVK